MGADSDDEIAEIIRRKSAYLEDRKRALGTEYYSAKQFWDRMWDAEWTSLNERMKEQGDESIEIDPLPITFPTLNYEGVELTLYSFDDFSLLHNQGIFRELKFIIDRKGRWSKNVITEMETYGYTHIKTITKEKYLIMEAL
mgnify:FL=1|tara:strand:+ start:563 stop:985 length:423 start_codon:yes stop_codon:yes gene_type:complete